jgi:hypothetical protein
VGTILSAVFFLGGGGVKLSVDFISSKLVFYSKHQLPPKNSVVSADRGREAKPETNASSSVGCFSKDAKVCSVLCRRKLSK